MSAQLAINTRLAGCATGDLTSQPLSLIPLLASRRGILAVAYAKAKLFDWRKRRRLVRSVAPTRVVVVHDPCYISINDVG
jgi:hypothetical protein